MQVPRLHHTASGNTVTTAVKAKRTALPDSVVINEKPQTRAVFRHLRDIGPLSGLTALQYYGIADLPKRISELKPVLNKYGYTILRTWSVDHPKHRAGIYSIVRKDTVQ